MVDFGYVFEMKYNVGRQMEENLCKILSNADINKCFNFQNKIN